MRTIIFCVFILAVAILAAGCVEKGAETTNAIGAKTEQPPPPSDYSAPLAQEETQTNAEISIGNEIESLENLDSDIDLKELEWLDRDLALVS